MTETTNDHICTTHGPASQAVTPIACASTRDVVRAAAGRALWVAPFFILLFALLTPQNANACTSCTYVVPAHEQTRQVVADEHDDTWDWIEDEFEITEDWIEDVFWPEKILPALKRFNREMSAVAMQNSFAIATFIDGENQLETQRLLQIKQAETHKDYQPSTQVCMFGTVTRNLIHAENNAELNAQILARRSIDRQMGNSSSSASAGQFLDRETRLANFKSTYCDPHDNNALFGKFCKAGTSVELQNLDVDYKRSLGQTKTLNIDFTDTDVTPKETVLVALANNLFSNDILLRIPEILTQRNRRPDLVLDIRSIVAKRAVAEHSFNTQIGLKTESNEGSLASLYPYLENIMKTVGLEGEDVSKLMGSNRPSYDAQMELITKKLYQIPAFYTNLYDKPANVDRQKAAMEAIGLMQDFDTWQSYLRTEASLAVLLELEIEKLKESKL